MEDYSWYLEGCGFWVWGVEAIKDLAMSMYDRGLAVDMIAEIAKVSVEVVEVWIAER